MWLTRDKGNWPLDEKTIEFWDREEKGDLELIDGDYLSDVLPIIDLSVNEFKRLFPDTKLPRKGSCKWVELRLFIP